MSLPSERLIVEAVPVAAILLFWNLLAWIAQFQGVGGFVRTAGTVMAALYVVVRGLSLSTKVSSPAMFDVETILRENARLAVPAGAWFVGAMVIGAVGLYDRGFADVLAPVQGALAGAGLGVVGLYAVAAGTAAVRRGVRVDGDGEADDGDAAASVADD